MIEFTNTKVTGIEEAIELMHRIDPNLEEGDSYSTYIEDPETLETAKYQFVAGDKDIANLIRSCSGYRNNCLELIRVCVDILAPKEWWNNGVSMHFSIIAEHNGVNPKTKIDAYSLDDFDCSNLTIRETEVLSDKIEVLNRNIEDVCKYLNADRYSKNTVLLDYLALRCIYRGEYDTSGYKFGFKNLKDRDTFVEWIESLPYSELITKE